jgi:hypothetical protein
LSGGRDRARERLVRVAVAESPMTAELLAGMLKEAGIRCMVKDVGPAPAVLGAGALASYELFVLEGDATAAAAVLSDELPDRPGQLPEPE